MQSPGHLAGGFCLSASRERFELSLLPFYSSLVSEFGAPMRTDLRLSIPSKGRLAEETVDFLQSCGIDIYKPNPRQDEASIPSIAGLTVLFQRPTDIVISVRNGSVDFGITGLDVLEEHRGPDGDILILHEALGYGKCALALAVPESWESVKTVADLRVEVEALGRPLKVAT